MNYQIENIRTEKHLIFYSPTTQSKGRRLKYWFKDREGDIWIIQIDNHILSNRIVQERSEVLLLPDTIEELYFAIKNF